MTRLAAVDKRQVGAHAAALLGVLLIAYAARHRVSVLPHGRADEMANLALAESLDRSGCRTYSMRHVDLRYFPLEGLGVGVLSYEEGPRVGAVIRYYRSGGNEHDRELSSKPPLFPFLLLVSRRLWGPPKFMAMGVQATDPKTGERSDRRREVERALARGGSVLGEVAALQRYATLLPLLASLLFVAATFLLVALQSPAQPGAPSALQPFVAALVAASVPMEILVAHLVQPDTVVAALGALGVVAGLLALRGEDGRGWAALAGLLLGVAALGKQTAIPLGVAYGLCELVQAKRAGSYRLPLSRLGIFTVVTILVSGWWYLQAAFNPTVAMPIGDLTEGAGGFVQLVLDRTWFTYPANILVHAPLLALGALGLPWLWRREGTTDLLLMTACATAIFAIGTWAYADRENRYLITLYPLLAAVAARTLEALRVALAERLRSQTIAAGLVYLPFAALVARGLYAGWRAPVEGFLVWNAETLLWPL